MPRPRSKRKVGFSPNVVFYKPKGVPISSMEIVELDLEEVEALRLRYGKKINQSECAKKMNTSQSTFQRILLSANTKLSEAVVNGKAIKINK